MLDGGVGAGEEEEEALVTVGPPHDVWGLTVGAVHLDDDTVAVRVAYLVAAHDDSVTDACVHGRAPSYSIDENSTIKPLETGLA